MNPKISYILLIVLVVFPITIYSQPKNNVLFTKDQAIEIADMLIRQSNKSQIQFTPSEIVKLTTKEDFSDFKNEIRWTLGIVMAILSAIYGLYIKSIKNECSKTSESITQLIERIHGIELSLPGKRLK